MTDGVRTADNIVETGEEPSRAELLRLIESMQHDWVLLNGYLNQTACSYEWCEEYESRLDMYNDGFAVMRLEGREQERRGRRGDPYLLPKSKLARLSVTTNLQLKKEGG